MSSRSAPLELGPRNYIISAAESTEKEFRVKSAPFALLCASLVLMASCQSGNKQTAQTVPALRPNFGAPGTPLPRAGDEIVVCGQMFHTGAPVVLWMDPGGYDAYRTDRRFAPYDQADFDKTKELVKDIKSPNRYNM